MKQKFKSRGSSWTLTDDAITYGVLFKNTIRLDEIRYMTSFFAPDRPDQEGHFTIYRLSLKERAETRNLQQNDPGITLYYRFEQHQDAVKAIRYIMENSGINEEERAKALRIMEYCHSEEGRSAAKKAHAQAWARLASSEPSKTNKKDASVVGRAVVGGVVAGPAGAVVGALSAVDKNNRNKE